MLELRNLRKTFDKRLIFDNFNLKLYPNKIYAIVGKSGSGKSTLLNLIAKIEKADDGKILYNDKNINKIKDTIYYRDYMGMLFQNFGLIENKSIKENLKLGLVGKRINDKKINNIMMESLKKVNIEYLDLNSKIYTLSGGESQRLALAKLILKNPALILADEPTASVDEKNEEEIINLLLSLKSNKRIIIIATHSKNVYERCDEIISLDKFK